MIGEKRYDRHAVLGWKGNANMKFLHLADLHIGRRLNGVSLLEDQRSVLKQAAEMAENVDAVLIAGDLYDKAQPSAEAVRTVSDFLVSLSKLGKKTFLVSGNHDSAEQVAYCRELLGECGVFVTPAFDGKLVSHVLHDAFGEVHVWMMPFIRPGSVRPFFPEVHSYGDAVSAALSTAELDAGARNVLVAHQFVGGAATCESETRLIGGLDEVSASLLSAFDYVALGHLHSPQTLGGGRICYAGSPLKYSLSEEKHHKSATVAELRQKGELAISRLDFHAPRELRTVTGLLADVAAPENASEDYVYTVLTDEGTLMDPLGTLRLTYPNLIGMRVKNSRTNEESEMPEGAEAERFTPLEHFLAFYEAQNNHQPPDEKRVVMMRQVIEEAEARQNAAN